MLKKAVDWQDIKHISIYEQLNLWYELVGTRNLYQPILSPFRTDTNIGGQVYLDDYKGRIVLADFSCREFHNIDIFNALIVYHNWNFGQMCDFIKSKNKLTFQPKIVEEIDKKCYITPNVLNGFYKPTIEYFSTYQISHKNLFLDKVLNCDKIFINRYDKVSKRRLIETSVMPPTHVLYSFPSGNYKLYEPLNEKCRFPVSNTNKNDLWIIDNKSDFLVISTSYKDIRVCSNILNCDSISPQNESIPKNTENTFSKDIWGWIYSHKTILVIGDQDTTGRNYQVRLGEEMSKYHDNVHQFSYPENIEEKNKYGKKNKDIAELFRYDDILTQELLNRYSNKEIIIH